VLEDPRAVVVPLEVVVDWWRCWPGALPLWPCEVVVVVARGGLAEGDELGGVGGAVAVGAWLPVAAGWPCPLGWALDATGLDPIAARYARDLPDWTLRDEATRLPDRVFSPAARCPAAAGPS